MDVVNCKDCHNENCKDRGANLRTTCWAYKTHPRPQTKADRIRSMTDEELDQFLGEVQWDVANYCGGVTQKQEYPVPEQRGAWLGWLKQEAEELV